MAGTSTLEEYKALLANFFRGVEIERARGDRQRIAQVDQMSDDDVMRKWMWLGSIVGGLAFFLVIPFVLRLINLFIPLIILEILDWLVKMGMGLVFIMFGLAIFFTVRKSSN